MYLAQTAILVLFWHPVLAFVLPLTLTERAASGSSPDFSGWGIDRHDGSRTRSSPRTTRPRARCS